METVQKHSASSKLAQAFMPATNHLVLGIATAATDDLSKILKLMAQTLMELWLEMVYTAAVLLERFQSPQHR